MSDFVVSLVVGLETNSLPLGLLYCAFYSVSYEELSFRFQSVFVCSISRHCPARGQEQQISIVLVSKGFMDSAGFVLLDVKSSPAPTL